MKEICVLKCLVRAPVSTKDDVVCIIGDWNAKVGSQSYLEYQPDLALEYKMKQGKQSLTEFYQENALVTASTLFQ